MAPEGTSSSLISQWQYHVFLSFTGQDTRKGFTDHLYAALKRKGIITFRDDNELQRGEVISQQLLHAIQQSLFTIVVLSPNYASSTWCLEELRSILESKNVLGRQVYPVFYGVDPSDVRNIRGSFAEAMRKHEEKYGGDKNKLQKWRDALNGVANLSGWDSKNWHEAELIEDIVAKLWKNLETKLPSYTYEVVGIESRIKELDSLLSLGSEDVRFIGIWGMGGVGKTTLARIIYERIQYQFKISCFLSNVREVSERSDGLVHLQRKLLSPLNISNLEISDLYDGKKKIRDLLCYQKVLLVLDDISCLSQLENLATNQEWFGPGSRIIVTTRDAHLLTSHGVSDKYEMRMLSYTDSLRLFSKKAFKRDQPPEGYLDSSKTVVENTRGLPLALEVLGSFLFGRNLSEWEDYVKYVKQNPPKGILNILRISYDGLEDAEKTLFLDIAFFFKGWRKDRVTKFLTDCGFYPTLGLNILVEKSLIICDGGILKMHDLLQEMARYVVSQESPSDARRRSRLWSLIDVNQVLTHNKETSLIEGITLKLSEPSEVHWGTEAFSNMCNLRVLIIWGDLHLPLGLKCLSSSLKYLEWEGYPLQSIPLGLPLDELVYLKMHYSKIERLWKRTQYFRQLKSIDLCGSKNLTKSPNIYGVPCLERLVLRGCVNLVKVHESVAQHKKLAILNLKGCINLKTLPKKLEMDALEEFILCGCSKVKKLPEFGEKMECLFKLSLNGCEKLLCLPQSIGNLKSLKKLKIGGCSNFSCLPNNLNEITMLEELDVSGCAGLLSSNSSYLPNRVLFGFRRYILIKGLKVSPLPGFSMLKELDLSNCNLTEESIPDFLGHLSSLEKLSLSDNNFVHLPDCIAKLPNLVRLDLDGCSQLQTLPVLPPRVEMLFVQNCSQLAPTPQRIHKFLEGNRWNLKSSIWFVIPGSEIPPWFHNQDYFPDSPPLANCHCHEMPDDFIVSIIVDIPDYCRSSEWWGIAVCLALDSTSKQKEHESAVFIRWASKDPDTEMDSPIHLNYPHKTHFSGQHLFIRILGTDEFKGLVQPNLKSDLNKVQLIIAGMDLYECGKLELRNCGCRVVVSKEDAQVWSKSSITSSVDMPSVSNDSIILKQARIREINNEFEGDVSTDSDIA